MNPTLKAPGSKRLKPKCDELLSTFAFNFNLRLYVTVKMLQTHGIRNVVIAGKARYHPLVICTMFTKYLMVIHTTPNDVDIHIIRYFLPCLRSTLWSFTPHQMTWTSTSSCHFYHVYEVPYGQSHHIK